MSKETISKPDKGLISYILQGLCDLHKTMQIKRKPIRGFGFLACRHSNCLATTTRLLIKKKFGLLYSAVEI